LISLSIAAPYPSGNQPFIRLPRKAASAPRLRYFERAFANSVGKAPYAWLVELRVSHAKSLLADRARPIAQIALECGFVDQAHFTNTFSRKVGVTPGKWRNENLPARL